LQTNFVQDSPFDSRSISLYVFALVKKKKAHILVVRRKLELLLLEYIIATFLPKSKGHIPLLKKN
jgi:hypothetical protein